MNSARFTGRALLVLILLSVLVRGFLAAFLEFGNDEVYYWTYALYPDYSHFDHPPMVGFLIQLSSLNLLLESEFFIRLGAVLLGGLNTWLIFLIGKKMLDALTGFYAALLYTGSTYAFIIAGTFILPDAPQLTFWLLSLYLLVQAFSGPVNKQSKKYILMAGITLGLALLSKYTSAFLLLGIFLYLIFYDRNWFRTWEIYVAALIAFLFFLPVLIWNYNNDFVSFTFQSDRIGIFESGLRSDFFFTELGGQFFYNNPVNFVLGVIALIAFFRGKRLVSKKMGMMLIFLSLPLISLFLFFSLFRHTLPHWTGPAWTTIILLSAAYLRYLGLQKNNVRRMPGWTVASLAVLTLVIILGIMQVKGGMLFYHHDTRGHKLGEKDVSLDMYGWRQLSCEFDRILEREEKRANIDPHSPFISSRWFPAANIDYYLAKPNGMDVLGIGGLGALHKYVWITEERGGLRTGMDAWFLTVSRDFRDPERMYGEWFESIEPADTIRVFRNYKHVMNAYFYYLKNLKQLPEDKFVKE